MSIAADTPRYRLLQPRNAAFWVLWPTVLVGVVLALGKMTSDAQYYASQMVIATILFVVYGAIFWWFTQRLDRYSALPASLIVSAFAWGGFAATFVMAISANDAVLAIYQKVLGQPWVAEWGAASTAPITEELAKGAGLLLLIALAPRLIRTAFDGFILGAFVGLGFQIIEDIVYASAAFGSQFGADPLQAGLLTLVMRSATGLTGHILYSSVFFAGLVYLLGRPDEPRRIFRGLVLMLAAMACHGLWDGGLQALLANIQYEFAVLSIPLGMVIALVVVVVTYRVTLPNERRVMRQNLEPEVEAGTLSAELADAVTGTRRQRNAYSKAASDRDLRKARKLQVEGAFDLAHALGTADGVVTEGVTSARAEMARLNALAGAGSS